MKAIKKFFKTKGRIIIISLIMLSLIGFLIKEFYFPTDQNSFICEMEMMSMSISGMVLIITLHWEGIITICKK